MIELEWCYRDILRMRTFFPGGNSSYLMAFPLNVVGRVAASTGVF